MPFRKWFATGFVAAAAVAPLLILGVPSANAATIDWAVWSNTYVPGDPGAASGTLTGNSVAYSGQLISVDANYPSWNPASTFSGGTIDNPPPQTGGIVHITGGSTTTNTVTFATAVINPVMAIWSLGDGVTASFDFNVPSTDFSIQSGGPSQEYNGLTIVQSGSNITGTEGNGTIQFLGTYSSISWTNPVYENWYGFTVGLAPSGGVGGAAPLPAALPLFGTVLGGGWLFSRMRKRRKA